MNVLHDIYPDWRSRMIETDLDCFYDDGIVIYTLEYLEKEWDDKNI